MFLYLANDSIRLDIRRKIISDDYWRRKVMCAAFQISKALSFSSYDL